MAVAGARVKIWGENFTLHHIVKINRKVFSGNGTQDSGESQISIINLIRV